MHVRGGGPIRGACWGAHRPLVAEPPGAGITPPYTGGMSVGTGGGIEAGPTRGGAVPDIVP